MDKQPPYFIIRVFRFYLRNDAKTLFATIFFTIRKVLVHKVYGSKLNTLINYVARASVPNTFLRLNFIATNQAWPGRREVFEKFIKELPKPVSFLEIGTWFREGSTEILIDSLKRGSKLYLVDSWKKYVSQTDVKIGPLATSYMDDLAFPAMHNAVKKVFDAEANHTDISINLLRGKSEQVLADFKDSIFDVIYIDGSHYYSNVLSDIDAAKRLCKKDFSIICGDDLESLPSPELIEFSKSNLEIDFVRNFHPGVLLAVSEHFEKVNMESGFWWVYCVNGRFTTYAPKIMA